MTKLKIIIEQVGSSAWTWEIRDAAPPRIGGQGRIAISGNDGDYGTFASPERAFGDATRWIARDKIARRAA